MPSPPHRTGSSSIYDLSCWLTGRLQCNMYCYGLSIVWGINTVSAYINLNLSININILTVHIITIELFCCEPFVSLQ